MQISVYQLQVNNFQNGQRIEKEDRKCFFNKIGVVTGKKESVDPELIWHLTNHRCWNLKEDAEGNTIKDEYDPIVSSGCKYKSTRYDRGHTNDDIIFRYKGEWWCADSCDWTQVKTLREAKRHIFDNGIWIKDCLPEGYKFKDIINRK
jgi:hypothetical protein